MLFETGLPPRWYLPREDVDASVLRPDQTSSVCAYKGIASYHTVEVDGHREEAIAWFYPEPEREVAPIVDRICIFLDEHVDTEKDGKKFCELMTVDYLERTTGAQSDAAKKKCESDVKAGSGDYPVKFDIKKPTKKTDNLAEVPVKSKSPTGTVKLKKEDGKFRIDDVE